MNFVANQAQATTTMVQKDVMAAQYLIANVGIALSDVPFNQLDSTNYMNYDWSSIDFARIAHANEQASLMW